MREKPWHTGIFDYTEDKIWTVSAVKKRREKQRLSPRWRYRQVLVRATLCRFKSCYPHHWKALKTLSFRGFFVFVLRCQARKHYSGVPGDFFMLFWQYISRFFVQNIKYKVMRLPACFCSFGSLLFFVGRMEVAFEEAVGQFSFWIVNIKVKYVFLICLYFCQIILQA